MQPGIDFSFAEGLRALMRQDPDIIMVGEIRDLETAEMAIQAALTGHLVLSTLHTNDAPAAVTRLLDFGRAVVSDQFHRAGSDGAAPGAHPVPACARRRRSCIMKNCGRRWLRLLLRQCQPAVTYKPVGCLECRNTGYMGRVGIYEVLMLSSGEVKRTHQRTHTDITKVREAGISRRA